MPYIYCSPALQLTSLQYGVQYHQSPCTSLRLTTLPARLSQRLAPELHYALLREQLMPRVVALCLRTTSLVVRTACLALMAQVAHRLDKEAAAGMLDVAGQVCVALVMAVEEQQQRMGVTL